MKKMLKSTGIGISIALAIFVIIGIVFDILYHGTFHMLDYSFTKMAVGCLLIGVGFGAPSAVYEHEEIPCLLQVVFHLGIGFAVFMIVSFAVGWMPTEAGIGGIIGYVIGDLAFVLIIWYLFYRHYKKEAAAINEKIRMRK